MVRVGKSAWDSFFGGWIMIHGEWMMEDGYQLLTIFHDPSSTFHFLLSSSQSPPAFPVLLVVLANAGA
jgi:hypothetical protein